MEVASSPRSFFRLYDPTCPPIRFLALVANALSPHRTPALV